jgi:hypothetical protein
VTAWVIIVPYSRQNYHKLLKIDIDFHISENYDSIVCIIEDHEGRY